jgi:hypothetical protein
MKPLMPLMSREQCSRLVEHCQFESGEENSEHVGSQASRRVIQRLIIENDGSVLEFRVLILYFLDS